MLIKEIGLIKVLSATTGLYFMPNLSSKVDKLTDTPSAQRSIQLNLNKKHTPTLSVVIKKKCTVYYNRHRSLSSPPIKHFGSWWSLARNPHCVKWIVSKCNQLVTAAALSQRPMLLHVVFFTGCPHKMRSKLFVCSLSSCSGAQNEGLGKCTWDA